MTTQPEALRLADALDAWDGTLMMPAGWRQRASAELRRLSAVEAQRDALLGALKALYDEQQGPPLIRRYEAWETAMQKARAAIKAVEEGK